MSSLIDFTFSILISICFFIHSTFTEIQIEIDTGILSTNLSYFSRNGKPFHAFLGIPYAAPPINELRFEAPKPLPPWQGIRSADNFGSICPQLNEFNVLDYYSSNEKTFSGDEDCLFLNVYTPQINPKSPMAVVVHIHGAAFIMGSSSLYKVHNFMDYPIVIVTANYRLGVLGFLSSGDEIISGNFALKDQVEVLKWVQRNIGAFGGDPNSVTMIGHSSGANNVHFHTLSPLSEGLFHRAIILSGSAIALWSYLPSKHAKSTFEMFVKEANCDYDTNDEITICLKHLSVSELKTAEFSILKNVSLPFVFRPVIEPKNVDQAFITVDPRQLQYPNPKMRILSGICSADGKMNLGIFLKGRRRQSNFYESLVNELPSLIGYKYRTFENETNNITQTLMNYYFNNSKEITEHDAAEISKIFGNLLFQMPSMELAGTYPGKIYQYLFDYEFEGNQLYQSDPIVSKIPGASHGSDSSLLLTAKANNTALEISKKLMEHFVQFILTGNPNHEAFGQKNSIWEPVNSSQVEFLFIDNSSKWFMKSGLFDDQDIQFYKSLSFDWLKIQNLEHRRTKPNSFTINVIILLIILVIAYYTLFFMFSINKIKFNTKKK